MIESLIKAAKRGDSDYIKKQLTARMLENYPELGADLLLAAASSGSL